MYSIIHLSYGKLFHNLSRINNIVLINPLFNQKLNWLGFILKSRSHSDTHTHTRLPDNFKNS